MLSKRQIRAVEQQLMKSCASADAEERTFLQSVLELLKRIGRDGVERLASTLLECIVREGIRQAARIIWTAVTGSSPPL
jgi:hypothetical protein